MSDPEAFLARWSRRKREMAPEAREPSKPEIARGDASSEASPDPASPVEDQVPVYSSSLPSIETIGAASDIRAFLAAGVPADLTRAALRRAWSADPAIRDFVGLSENSWDFNASGAVPGFGPIDTEEVGRLITRLLGEPDTTAATARSAADSPTNETQELASGPSLAEETQPVARPTPPTLAVDEYPRQRAAADATNGVTQPANASRCGSFPSGNGQPTPRRGHGGALPK